MWKLASDALVRHYVVTSRRTSNEETATMSVNLMRTTLAILEVYFCVGYCLVQSIYLLKNMKTLRVPTAVECVVSTVRRDVITVNYKLLFLFILCVLWSSVKLYFNRYYLHWDKTWSARQRVSYVTSCSASLPGSALPCWSCHSCAGRVEGRPGTRQTGEPLISVSGGQ